MGLLIRPIKGIGGFAFIEYNIRAGLNGRYICSILKIHYHQTIDRTPVMQSILIVDDDPYIVKLIGKILESEGYDVMTASNGNMGLKSFKAQRPDLAIVDIVMPEKEGLETITEFKRVDPGARIIAISGGGKGSPSTYLPIAKKLGAAATIAKPFKKSELVQKVKAILTSG